MSYNEYLGRNLGWDQKVEDAVRAASVEQVNAAVKEHLDPTRMCVVMAGSFAAPPKVAEPVATAQDGVAEP